MYVLMYAKDVRVPPHPSNTATKEFKGQLSLFWFILRHKSVRAAMRADRFQLLHIEDTK